MHDLEHTRVWVAGHTGFVGRAVARQLARAGCEILTVNRETLDLRHQADVEAWLREQQPDIVVLAAATIGGIEANRSRPADFIYDNLAIELAVIHGAYQAGVGRLMFLGAACVYPRVAEQPIAEDSLLTGPFEATNEWYSVAKVAGMKLCEAYRRQYGVDYISVVPANLYGPGDHFDLANSHVCGALMTKIHLAKLTRQRTIEIWGTGTPRREFLYIDDMAEGLEFLLRNYSAPEPINLGGAADISIRELAEAIARTVGWEGEFSFDLSKPDGMPRKSLDGSRVAALGWRPSTPMQEGLRRTYEWFVDAVAPEIESPAPSVR